MYEQVNRKNVIRGVHAFFPPKLRKMDGYYERGMNDAITFLKSEGSYEEEVEKPRVDAQQNNDPPPVMFVTAV